MDFFSILIAVHVIGTILGTGGATIAELQLLRALKDKRISPDEKALMHVNYGMIRVGMVLILLSVLGMFWYFYSQGSSYLLTNEKLWIKDLMFVMIFLNAIALQKHWVPLWLGASISFTSWWGATLLGLAGDLPFQFTTYLIGYVIMICVVAGVLHLLRNVYSTMRNHKKTITSGFVVVAAIIIFVVYRAMQGGPETAPETITPTESAIATRQLSSTVEYDVPGGSHTVEFTIAIDDSGDIAYVKGLDVTDPGHQDNIDSFVESLNTKVKGKKLSELEEIDVVGTSSLTTDAFNDSLANIQAQL